MRPSRATPSADDDLRAILQASPYNRQAGAVLRQHRKSIGMTQDVFCRELAREFGITPRSSTLSGWETGERGVPGSVLTAAATIAQRVTGTKPASLEDKILDSQKRIEAGVAYLLGSVGRASVLGADLLDRAAHIHESLEPGDY